MVLKEVRLGKKHKQSEDYAGFKQNSKLAKLKPKVILTLKLQHKNPNHIWHNNLEVHLAVVLAHCILAFCQNVPMSTPFQI